MHDAPPPNLMSIRAANIRFLLPLLACAGLFFAQYASAESVCCTCKGPPDVLKTTCLQLDSEKLGSTTDCSKLKDAAKLSNDWSCDAKAISADECAPVSGSKASAKCVLGPKSALDVAGEAVAAAKTASTRKPIPLTLNTPIPGLAGFADVTGEAFGQYVSAAFRFMLSIVAVTAIIMFTYGAFLYLLSSAIPAIKNGKKYMFDSVIGLLLVLSASLILRTINPDTVTLSFVQVEAVKGMAARNEYVLDPNTKPNAKGRASYTAQFQQFSPDDLKGSTIYPAQSDAVQQPLKVPALKMFLGPWATVAYGPKDMNACAGTENRPSSVSKCCTTYWHAGCGPTSLATLLQFNGVSTDPNQVGDIFVSSGGRICNNGTLMTNEAMNAIQKAYPVKFNYLGTATKGLVAAIGSLRRGQPVMFLCGGCQGKKSDGVLRSYPGHYMVLTGVDSNGQVFSVDDVGNNDPYAIVSMTQEQLMGKVGGYWNVEKK
jgi:hypothetical protein